MSMSQYKSLFVTLENVDHLQISPADQGQECYFAVTLGDKSSKSATALLPREGQIDVPVAFDSILTFPFDCLTDPEIVIQLKEKLTGSIIGGYILKTALFENRDSSLSARMKLKSLSGSTIGYLNARITLSPTVVPRTSAARFVRTDTASKALTGTDSGAASAVVPLFDESRHSTRSIQCTVYQIEEIQFPAKALMCQVELEGKSLIAPAVRKSVMNGTEVFGINRSFVFPFSGETFLKFRLFNEDKKVVGMGAMDLGNFVTKKQNVVAGAWGVESEAGFCVGKMFFRMERFQSIKALELTDELDFSANVNPLRSGSIMPSVELRPIH